MTFVEIYTIAAAVILGLMTLLWIASLILRDAGIVDIFWGTGFVVANWLYFALTPNGLPARKWLISALVTLWGLRLSLRILLRNWGKPEDFRYHAWRTEAGGKWWWQSFIRVFLLQGFLLWLISAPLLAAQIGRGPDRLTPLDIAAIPLWAIGFFFEAVGDWQLDRFKADPANRGKVLRTGLWRYTRHPNYFGDAVQWWSYYLLAIAAGGYWTFFSPIIMTELLVRISGVTLLEKSLVERKPGYRDYIETTSPFIPWFPRSNCSEGKSFLRGGRRAATPPLKSVLPERLLHAEKEVEMEWINILPENELADGERKVVKVDDHSILLIREKEQVYAIASACPHMRLPLKGGKVEDHTITCPWHHSAFDLQTGDVKDWSPWPPVVGKMLGALSRKHALPTFPAKIEEGAIWVGIE